MFFKPSNSDMENEKKFMQRKPETGKRLFERYQNDTAISSLANFEEEK